MSYDRFLSIPSILTSSREFDLKKTTKNHHSKSICIRKMINVNLLILFTVFVINNYSNAASTMQIATYDEVKDLPNHPEVLLVDVREPQELIDYGVIPTSINIPRKCFFLQFIFGGLSVFQFAIRLIIQ